MFLRRLSLGEFIKPGDKATSYPETPDAMKVCCVCRSDDPEDNDLNDWVSKLTAADINAFKNGMSMILKLANAGKKLENHYDEKKCHPTHRFEHNEQERVVWRVRNSDVRLLFYYGNDRILLMVDSFPKRTDKITKAQKSHAEKIIKSYLDADEVTILGAENEQ
jgi:mRNA-degrading endonuclease RelE of RelBE toxin-antitoxin system